MRSLNNVCYKCERRHEGCKKDCLDYLIESIQLQPVKEKMKKEKEVAYLIKDDFRKRTKSAFSKPITYNSPMHDRSTKHERD